MNINSLVFILCFSAPLVSALQLAAAYAVIAQLLLKKQWKEKEPEDEFWVECLNV